MRVVEQRMQFDLFKSEMCHLLMNYGDYEFIKMIVKEDWVKQFWNKEWYPECLYTLAMLDYLSKVYDAPKLKKYDFYRRHKMENIVYPRDILLIDRIQPDAHIKEKILEECRNNECSVEFLKYNIIEGDIRDVK